MSAQFPKHSQRSVIRPNMGCSYKDQHCAEILIRIRSRLITNASRKEHQNEQIASRALLQQHSPPEVALPPICPIPPDAPAAAACCAMNCAMNDPSFANGNFAIEYRETATLYSKKAKLSKYSAHELGHQKKR